MAYTRCCCIGDDILESESVGGEFAEVDVSGAAFVGDGFSLQPLHLLCGHIGQPVMLATLNGPSSH